MAVDQLFQLGVKRSLVDLGVVVLGNPGKLGEDVQSIDGEV
jgi:hypothetical protein